MDRPLSDMEKQLQDTDRVSLAIAMEMNKVRRGACLFFGVATLCAILFFGWNRWFLLVPAALGVGAFLFQMNLVIVRSELKRRST